MLVLLPPSETKATGGDGPKLATSALGWQRRLGPTRTTVIRALVTLCRGNRLHQAVARDVLGLSAGLDDQRAANALIRSAPTLPAGLRYAGVLYDALGYSSLPDAASALADVSLVTFSGLWGAVRPTDPIPAYRLGINTRLPGLPGIPGIWRDPLGAALSSGVLEHGAIDLRSTGYSQMARWTPAAREQVVTVTVRASSFAGKQVKGLIVRELLVTGVVDADGLMAAATKIGLRPLRTMGAVTIDVPPVWTPPGEPPSSPVASVGP